MISIIIPTLNEEDCLRILLESIKKQDFNDYEIIIADGGSKDRTREIAKNYGCKIVSGGSPAKGRNEGTKIAQGDLLFFIDADSALPQSFFSKLLKEFKRRKLDLASFPVYPVRGYQDEERTQDLHTSNGVYPRGNLIDKILYGIYNLFAWATQRFLPHATQTILIKKEIHHKINGFNEEIKIGEDHAYARAGAKHGKFGFLLNVPPILTSARRFEQEGRLKVYSIFLLAGFYMLFFKNFKSNIFKYHDRHFREKKEVKNKK